MASPNPYPPPNNASFPALHLYPLDDSFIPKRIALGGGQRVKIARPPNTKTQPGERNGYFDSRVLSRQHAEVWEEGGKIFIKDVKSSNGTFINGERLSLEGRESDNFELKSDDILEFGVDIVSEDNKTVLHRKVVARVACVFPGKNGGGGGPPPLPHDQFATMSHAGAAFNGMAAPRRPQVPMIHQGLAGLGGMGNTGPRAPGRGLTLDHIFSRLQAELAKSRDTGHDLQVLTGALNNIEDTLNGALPPTNPPQFPDALPPVRPPPPQRAMSVPSLPQVPAVASPISPEPRTDAIAGLQAQLREHQEALAAHVEGIRALEGVLAEQEAMKREVRELREWVGVDRHGREGKLEGVGEEAQGEGEEGDDDDSDTRSIMTTTPHELDAVEEDMEGEGLEQERDARDAQEQFEDVALTSAQEDAEAEAQEREENMRRERAQTPEPSLDREDSLSPPRSPAPPSPSHPHTHPALELEALESLEESSPSTTLSLAELTTRLALLTEQLESALAASSALQAQHASAQATIAGLEEKIARLEALSSPSPSSSPSSPPSSSSSDSPHAPTEAEVTEVVVAAPDVKVMEAVQEELAQLRAELALERGRREKWAEGVEERVRLQVAREREEGKGANGNVSESWMVRRRTVGRSRSRSGSASRSRNRRRSASPAAGAGMDEEDIGMDDSMRLEQLELGDFRPSKTPVLAAVREEKSLRAGAGPTYPQMNVQTAVGVLILGIAAAAVLWRVKPE